MATTFKKDERVQFTERMGALRGKTGRVLSTPTTGRNARRYYEVVLDEDGLTYTATGADLEPARPSYEPTPEHLRDIALISETMRDVADEQDWCIDGYNEVVEELNKKLSVKIPLREEDFTVTIQGENYNGGGFYSDDTQESVTVSATSEDEAVEKVTEIVQKYLRGELVEKS